KSDMGTMERIGRRSVLACPDCHGVMWEIDDGEVVRYRCHVGHAFSAEYLSMALGGNLSRALGSALRALEERVAVSRKLEKQAIDHDRPNLANTWAERSLEFEHEAEIIRDSIKRLDELAFRTRNEETAVGGPRQPGSSIDDQSPNIE